jgi:hypothetical protein
MKVGYARVSIREQSFDLQIDALQKAGCEKVYRDLVSGARAERPVLERMLAGGSVRLPAGCPRGGERKGHLVCGLKGGEGAFREFAEVIVAARTSAAR